MSLSFQNFEDTFSAPRRSFEAQPADEVKDELAVFTISFGQFLFDTYYGCRQPPSGSPMVLARWERRRQQLAEELKAESFTLPVDWAKDLYEHLSDPEAWKKTVIYPRVTFKDGSSNEIQLNQAGAALFQRSMDKIVNQLLDYFEPRVMEAEVIPNGEGRHDDFVSVQ